MMKDAVILVSKPWLGHVSSEDAGFGGEMLDKFLHSLEPLKDKPRAICLYTEGVKAAAKGAPVELGLKLLAADGVEVLICQSCLDHYGLKEQIAVGQVVGMNQIVAIMAEASEVITI